ncbi:hypothetical protein TRFO_30762 [Tritrichomonas foetus]|uniref:Uncharacterized protein n=1 Tax=Tritrichomonas foetus TaxID=1144522 RepID=A0A1J4JUQ0_9EUKA|nr:hypothetical protein TRFO_30762 [Tritrichomonas foetus]|eukprot:OHT02200.1 hypothetical protein TRFO_30762 [Tritrichomonas foetus]
MLADACFFPYRFTDITFCRPFLVVALADNTINIIDSEIGAVVFPQVLVSETIVYLSSDGNYFFCISSDMIFRAWEISQNFTLNHVLTIDIEINFGTIKKVIITNELENDSLSPIFFLENRTMRYSQTTESWFIIPDLFTSPTNNFNISDNPNKNIGVDTLYEMKRQFFHALTTHSGDKATFCLSVIIKKFMIYNR